MPAIEGTRRLRSCWLPLRRMPPPARNASGSTKLKNAALGLRQNMRRSRRYCRQLRATASGIRGQLQVDVLERRPSDGQLLQAAPVGKRLRGQLVKQRGRVLGLLLDQLTLLAAVGDAIVGGADAELARWPDREHAPVLDDRDAVGQSLR